MDRENAEPTAAEIEADRKKGWSVKNPAAKKKDMYAKQTNIEKWPDDVAMEDWKPK